MDHDHKVLRKTDGNVELDIKMLLMIDVEIKMSQVVHQQGGEIEVQLIRFQKQ